MPDIYYVDATLGDDGHDGKSEGNAWKTINQVNISSFNPGDTIKFKRGETWREQLTVPSGGSSGLLITFTVYGSGVLPIINGAEIVTGWTQEGNYYYKGGYGTIPKAVIRDGVLLENWDAKADLDSNQAGWYYDAGNSRVYIYGNPATYTMEIQTRNNCINTNAKAYLVINELYLCGADNAVAISSGGSDITVQYCNFKNNGNHHINTGSTPGNNIKYIGCTGQYSYGTGYTLYAPSSTGCLIQGCIADQSGVYNEQIISVVDGTGIYMESINGIVEHCEVSNNATAFRTRTSPHDWRYSIHGIYMGANGIVRYCNAYNNCYGGIKFFGNAGAINDASCYYNLVWSNNIGLVIGGSTTGLKVWNNVIYQNSAASGGPDGNGIYVNATSTIASLKNNIIMDNLYQNAPGQAVNVNVESGCSITEADNNCIYYTTPNDLCTYQGVSKSWAGWQALGFDTHGINTDPLFVNPPTDFHLQSGSPCINIGTNVGLSEDYDANPVPM